MIIFAGDELFANDMAGVGGVGDSGSCTKATCGCRCGDAAACGWC